MNLATNEYPNGLINLLSTEQRTVFLTLFNKKESTNIDLLKDLNKLISSFGGWFNDEKTYLEILKKVCKKTNLKINNNFSIYEIEELILKNKFNSIYNSLNKEHKQKFDEEIRKIALQKGINANQAKSITAIGTLTSANLAGFGLYVMASTVLGGITSAIGLTLPFAFYTGMSSVLTIITGPVGWIAGLGYMAYTFRNDNLETAQSKLKNTYKGIKNIFTGNIEYCEIIISQICSFRILLKQEFENQITKNKTKVFEIEQKLPEIKQNKIQIQQELFTLQKKLTQLNSEISHSENSLTEYQKELIEINAKLNLIT